MVGSLQPLAFPHLHTASGTVHRSPPPCRRPRPLSPFWLSMRTIPKWPERHMHVHGNSNGVLVLANVAPTRHWLGFLVYGGGASKFPWQCRWGVCVCVCVCGKTNYWVEPACSKLEYIRGIHMNARDFTCKFLRMTRWDIHKVLVVLVCTNYIEFLYLSVFENNYGSCMKRHGATTSKSVPDSRFLETAFFAAPFQAVISSPRSLQACKWAPQGLDQQQSKSKQ